MRPINSYYRLNDSCENLDNSSLISFLYMHRWCLHGADQLLLQVLIPGRVAQSVTCLATDAKLTADPGVVSSIPARPHTFVEIYHDIISTDILLPSAESYMKGCCQLQAKVCAQITGYPLVQACPGKKCG